MIYINGEVDPHTRWPPRTIIHVLNCEHHWLLFAVFCVKFKNNLLSVLNTPISHSSFQESKRYLHLIKAKLYCGRMGFINQ